MARDDIDTSHIFDAQPTDGAACPKCGAEGDEIVVGNLTVFCLSCGFAHSGDDVVAVLHSHN